MPFLFAWKSEVFHFSRLELKRHPVFSAVKSKPTAPAPVTKTRSSSSVPSKLVNPQSKKSESGKPNSTTENGSNGGGTQESAYNDVLAAEQAIREIEKEAQLKTPLRHIRNVNTDRKVVALTFDDGPHPIFTAQILRTLDFYNAKATFFLVGSIAEHYPLWVGMEAHANHTVGSHTYSHLRLDFLDEEETQFQLEHNQKVLSALTSNNPRYFRPPGGRFNAQAAKAIDQLNLTLVWWTVNTNDLAGYNTDYILSKVKEGLKPGAIFLLHDGSQTTVDALPQVLDYIKSQGYQMVSIEELDRISGIPQRKVELPSESPELRPSAPASEAPSTSPPTYPTDPGSSKENKV